MKKLVYLLICSLLLMSCSDPAPTLPNPTNPTNPIDPTNPTEPDDGTCTSVLAEDITVPSKLVNTPKACDYSLEGPVYIKSRLVIEPGVVVRAKKDAVIRVAGGEFLAVGNAQNRIVFEGQNHLTGYWEGIDFREGRESRIEYVDIKDAGQENCAIFCDKAGLVLDDVTVSFVHSSISNSYVNGLDISDSVVLTAFSNNRFYGNTWAGIVLYPNYVPLLDTASDYAGEGDQNGKPYIQLSSSELNDGEDRSWEKLNAPYFVAGYLHVKGGSLNLAPGVEMVFGRGARMTVQGNGVFSAVGTADAPVLFRGTKEQAGYWDSIEFWKSPWDSNTLEHVQIRHAGGSDSGLSPNAGAIYLHGDSSVKISNSLIADNAKYGVSCSAVFDTNNVLELGSGNTFSNNASGDIDPDCEAVIP